MTRHLNAMQVLCDAHLCAMHALCDSHLCATQALQDVHVNAMQVLYGSQSVCHPCAPRYAFVCHAGAP